MNEMLGPREEKKQQHRRLTIISNLMMGARNEAQKPAVERLLEAAKESRRERVQKKVQIAAVASAIRATALTRSPFGRVRFLSDTAIFLKTHFARANREKRAMQEENLSKRHHQSGQHRAQRHRVGKDVRREEILCIHMCVIKHRRNWLHFVAFFLCLLAFIPSSSPSLPPPCHLHLPLFQLRPASASSFRDEWSDGNGNYNEFFVCFFCATRKIYSPRKLHFFW